MALEPKVLEKYLDIPAKKLSYQSYFLWLLPRIPFFLLKYFQVKK
jgi:hypothetical protein